MTDRKRRKKKLLSEEDRALWAKVTKTLTPLERNVPKASPEEVSFEELFEGKDKTKAEKPVHRKTATAMRPTPQPKSPAPPPLATLEHKFRRKLVRGVTLIEARIDLHGLRQEEAHTRLRGFLYDCQSRGHKVVLVITGKGGSAQTSGNWSGLHGEERGVLRRVVPHWLSMPDLRSVVVGYEQAHLSHGGAGALYVRIRRRR